MSNAQDQATHGGFGLDKANLCPWVLIDVQHELAPGGFTWVECTL
jgi:hypothetical protein